MPYEILDHTADVFIRVTGESERALFENAAAALGELIAGRAGISPDSKKEVRVEGEDRTERMVNWLREILWLWVGEGLIPVAATVREIEGDALSATVSCVAFDPARHDVGQEIKAVTWHKAAVGQDESGWWATVVFDV